MNFNASTIEKIAQALAADHPKPVHPKDLERYRKAATKLIGKLSNPKPTAMVYTYLGHEVFRVSPDGIISFSPLLKPDEASREAWELLQTIAKLQQGKLE